MRFKVIVTRKARIDIEDIYNYIFYELSSPESAEALIQKLFSKINSLTFMSERFRKASEIQLKLRNIRVMKVENFRVYYISEKSTKEIVILRIIYKRRSIQKLINSGEF